VYAVDVASNPLAPKIYKTVEPAAIKSKVNIGNLHTSHCLANGQIMISGMGDSEGKAKGSFLLLNEKFEIDG